MTTIDITKIRRTCGECSLCCYLVPVKEINKRANSKCAAQTEHGCKVYGSDRMPTGCRLWSCRWVVNADMADQLRPDQSHLVVDMIPDYVDFQWHDTGRIERMPVVQVWIDPAFPDAWKADTFRTYMLRRCAQGYGFLIRNGNDSAKFVLAPTYWKDGGEEWFEMESNLKMGKQHSMREIAEAVTQCR